jgi:hypothetical protein
MKPWQPIEIKPVTVVDHDQAIADGINARLTVDVPTVSYPIDEVITKKDAGYQQASLARQLANDEPKCGNCRYWFALVRGIEKPIGNCDLIAQAGEAVQVRTTDLSVCSKWTGK